MQEVVCLIAPTASGKTALAYELYDTGKYYLISVDSALIYRDMNIGTAKPTSKELQQYPHALVDIINPDQSYSVAQFVKDVKIHIQIAHQQQKIPLLVGGTMMYYMALFDGLADIPKTNPEIRQQVLIMIANQGIEKVYQYLQTIDPVIAKRLKPNDSQRIGRAVEIFLQTQKPLSQWQKNTPTALANTPDQRWQVYAILPDRQWLHQRIAQRLDIMWQQGLLTEVLTLQQKYHLNSQMPSMRCVGYRQVWDFLQTAKTYINFTQDTHSPTQTTALLLKTNNFDLINARQTMQNQALYATRQLAKRQYTWLRKLTNLGKSSQPYVIQELTTVEQARQRLIR